MTALASGCVALPRDVLNRAVAAGDVAPIRTWCEREGITFKEKVRAVDIVKVFDEHTRLFWCAKGRPPTLLREKRDRIRKRLERYTVDELILAMHVAHGDPFWNGAKNDRGAFLGIDNLFRNDERVEKFLQKAEEQGVHAGDSDVRKLHENRDALLLQIEQIAARMRDGTASLQDKSGYVQRVKVLEADHGLTFDWRKAESKHL